MNDMLTPAWPQVLHEMPEPLLTVPAVLIKQVLSGPTLIHLPGQIPQPLFVSILLHGNEDVGLKAIQQVLAKYAHSRLPRALSIFVGNVDAAEAGVRFLPGEPDYNRVWPGSDSPPSAVHQLMATVVEMMIDRGVAASIDLHNNTGRNPYYACVCSLSHEHLQLAALFAPRVMYFQRPKGVQTAAFSAFCPSITCECGPIGDTSGVRAAAELIERVLNLDGDLRAALPAIDQSLQLYRTQATFKICSDATVDFALHSQADVVLKPDLDLLNFQPLDDGVELARLARPMNQCVFVQDESGRDVTTEYLQLDDGALRLRQPVIPSMFTDSLDAIRKDCIGYFMTSAQSQSDGFQ